MNPIDFLVDRLMLPVLNSFHSLTGSYGWSIILLTIFVKTLLLPLTIKSYHSMKEMQRIQPRMKQLQERYKGKPEELNKQIMMLYKEHKVNPFGGCLPILLQMPFLIALYAALMGNDFKTTIIASGHKSFFFVTDLTASGIMTDTGLHIENLILVILFGLTTFWQQKVMTIPGHDPASQAMQKQMLYMMPIMITGMFFIFPVPSGVFIYLVASNVISVAQYAYLNQSGSKQTAALSLATGPNGETFPTKDLMTSISGGVDSDEQEKRAVTKKSPRKKKRKK